MKLRFEFENAHARLINRNPVPSVDVYIGKLLCEEQSLISQLAITQDASVTIARNLDTLKNIAIPNSTVIENIIKKLSCTTSKLISSYFLYYCSTQPCDYILVTAGIPRFFLDSCTRKCSTWLFMLYRPLVSSVTKIYLPILYYLTP